MTADEWEFSKKLAVHSVVRDWFADRGASGSELRVLYGGSVSTSNANALMKEPGIDGVLVGGASLKPDSWAQICQAVSID